MLSRINCCLFSLVLLCGCTETRDKTVKKQQKAERPSNNEVSLDATLVSLPPKDKETNTGLRLRPQPAIVTVEACFLVDSNRPGILEKVSANRDARAAESMRATHLALVNSYSSCQSALANPDFDLSETFLIAEEDPALWLQENVNAHYEGDSELLVVAIQGPQKHADDLVKCLSAVCDSYLQKCNDRERSDKLRTGDLLESMKRNLQNEIRTKWDEYRQLSNDLGYAEAGSGDLAVQIVKERLALKLKEKAQLESEQRKVQLELLSWNSRQENSELKVREFNRFIAADPNLQATQKELLKLQAQLREAEISSQVTRNNNILSKQTEAVDQGGQSTNRRQDASTTQQEPIGTDQVKPVAVPDMRVEEDQPPTPTALNPTADEATTAGYDILRLKRMISLKQQQIEQLKSELSEQLRQRFETERKAEAEIRMRELQQRLLMNATRLQHLQMGYDVNTMGGDNVREFGIDELQRELEAMTQGYTELTMRKRDLQLLQETYDQLFLRIERWNIESQSEPRLQIIEQAHVAKD